jgi:fructokinase
MKRVICFGEALIDFLNTGAHVDGALDLSVFTQFPGGAPANAAVAVAKLGGQSVFAGQVGDDHFGHFLIESLETYGVSTRLTNIHPSAKTALAFVFLDDAGERSFSFYRDKSADVVFSKDLVSEDWFADDPIFHYCSNTLTDPTIADVTRYIVSMAGSQEFSGQRALISFDVNLRHNLWPTGAADKALVNDLVARSHLVKYSRDEFEYLSDGNRDGYLASCFSRGVVTVLITDGADTVSVYTRDTTFTLEPPAVQAIDTTGGGDAFIGAVLFGLSQQEDPMPLLSEADNLKPLIGFAAHCGAFTVTRKGAFPALPSFDDVAHAWKT